MCGVHQNSSGADVALWDSPNDVVTSNSVLGVGESKIFTYFEVIYSFSLPSLISQRSIHNNSLSYSFHNKLLSLSSTKLCL